MSESRRVGGWGLAFPFVFRAGRRGNHRLQKGGDISHDAASLQDDDPTRQLQLQHYRILQGKDSSERLVPKLRILELQASQVLARRNSSLSTACEEPRGAQRNYLHGESEVKSGT